MRPDLALFGSLGKIFDAPLLCLVRPCACVEVIVRTRNVERYLVPRCRGKIIDRLTVAKGPFLFRRCQTPKDKNTGRNCNLPLWSMKWIRGLEKSETKAETRLSVWFQWCYLYSQLPIFFSWCNTPKYLLYLMRLMCHRSVCACTHTCTHALHTHTGTGTHHT